MSRCLEMGSGDGSNLHDESCTCWRHVRVIRDSRVTCGRTDRGGGGGVMTTNGDFWGLMGTKNHGDSG